MPTSAPPCATPTPTTTRSAGRCERLGTSDKIVTIVPRRKGRWQYDVVTIDPNPTEIRWDKNGEVAEWSKAAVC